MKKPTEAEFLEEASSPNTLPERLRELTEQGEELSFLVAQNPSAPPGYLVERLENSNNQSLRRVVMQNPNTPFEALFLHADEFPEEFFENPSLPLHLLQNPSALYEKDPPKALLHSKAPSWFLLILRGHRKLYIRLQAAGFLLLDLSFIEELSHDPDPNIRCLVAEHKGTPPEVLRRLRDDPEDKVRRVVVMNPHTPTEIIEASATEYPREVSQNPEAPTRLLDELSVHEMHWVRTGVARNPSTSIECLERLATDPNELVRQWVAKNAKLPAPSIGLMTRDSSANVRKLLALRPDLSDDDIIVLSKDDSAEVRAALCINYKTPEAILHLLAHDPANRVRHAVASLLKMPASVLQKMAEQEGEDAVPFAPHSGLFIKRLLLQHPNAPRSLREFLAQDKDFTIRSEAQAALQGLPK